MNHYRLYENQPAERFEDAHLLGNGALGATVYGGVPYEKILINHDTLWSGQENDKINKRTLEHFPAARQLVLEGKLKDATTLINDEMLGYWSESFLPLGSLHLTMGHKTDCRPQNQKQILEGAFPTECYSRTLTLNDAVERISYDYMGCKYTREIFVSKPDNVIAVKLAAAGGSLDFSMALDSPLKHEQQVFNNGVAITGRAPDRVESYNPRFKPDVVYRLDELSDTLRFAAVARVVDTDGIMSRDDYRLYVQNATYAVILVSAGTNYKGFRAKRDKDVEKVLASCEETLKKAMQKTYAKIIEAHITDYQKLYNRFSLDLGDEITDSLPTSERLKRMKNIDDPSVIALVTRYVRYLLIAFSRPGSQAGNLQGIWNPNITPVWASNYTTNINVQMNYWSAEALNLSDCHEPMMDLVRECAEAGKTAATETYGLPGWVTHHNTDLWRFSALAGEDASWSWWAFGGFWMCQHLWQHYEFTQDREFLMGTVYPVLRSAAEFLCAFVVKDEGGYYVTAPSTSPENKFFINGSSVKDAVEEIRAGNRMSANRIDTAEVCKSSTMDLAITKELLGNLKKTVEILGLKDELIPRIDEVLTDLTPFRISKLGTLQEWDQDFEECTPGMGHVSHLYTIYPSEVITEDQPELYEAARQSLIRRIQHGHGETVGWPGAWKVSLLARYGDGTQCNLVSSGLSGALGANMLMNGYNQIDAIMGWGAGISEMLLQSHNGVIRLLPALAPSWRIGKVMGMRARGGVQVDMEWKEAKLCCAAVEADKDGVYRFAYNGRETSLALKAGEIKRLNGALQIIE